MIDAIFEKGFCDCLVNLLCSHEKEEVTKHTGKSSERKAHEYAQKADMSPWNAYYERLLKNPWFMVIRAIKKAETIPQNRKSKKGEG